MNRQGIRADLADGFSDKGPALACCAAERAFANERCGLTEPVLPRLHAQSRQIGAVLIVAYRSVRAFLADAIVHVVAAQADEAIGMVSVRRVPGPVRLDDTRLTGRLSGLFGVLSVFALEALI